jgi:hypothetical protein
VTLRDSSTELGRRNTWPGRGQHGHKTPGKASTTSPGVAEGCATPGERGGMGRWGTPRGSVSGTSMTGCCIRVRDHYPASGDISCITETPSIYLAYTSAVAATPRCCCPYARTGCRIRSGLEVGTGIRWGRVRRTLLGRHRSGKRLIQVTTWTAWLVRCRRSDRG